jgi:hypothetical protein
MILMLPISTSGEFTDNLADYPAAATADDGFDLFYD